MRFQRINDKVIRCVVSKEELLSRGVNIEDLMDNRGKAEEFLQYVLNQARSEMDYETSGDILNVQLSVMHDGEINMMISDDHNAAIRAIAEQFHSKLAAFKEALDKVKDKAVKSLEDSPQADRERVLSSLIEHTKDKDVIDFDFWTMFYCIDDCIEMADTLGNIEGVVSSLYRYNDKYYINTSLSVPKSQIARNVFIMSEYAQTLNAQVDRAPVIKEHGKLIIKNDALEVLRTLK